MAELLAFSTVLAIAVLVSQLAHRTILSTALIFLVAGFLVGPGVIGAVHLSAKQPSLRDLSNFALFSVLFSDGMAAGLGDLRKAWHLPGRALLFGMPLTFATIALFARYLAGLSWIDAFLIGAVLSPTDPVFAAAIVGRDEVPVRLRHLLNVESGLNDGLALPVVVVLLSVAQFGHTDIAHLVGDLALGVALGIAVPWIYIRLERSRLFSASALYEPLGIVAVGLGLLSLSSVTHANAFLAAFTGGITIASISPAARDAFRRFGELITELLKLAALMAFGAIVTPRLLGDVGVGGWLFTFCVIVVGRPAPLSLSLIRSGLPRRERIAAAWFGPKGFASVVYGLMVLSSSVPAAERIFGLTVVTVAVSIIGHSSTDVPIAKWLENSKNPLRRAQEP